jgi:HPr kinase/phosphorylase
MREPINAQVVFKALQTLLALHWIGGQDGATRRIETQDADHPNLAGRLNWIQPHPIQLLAKTEFQFLDSLGEGIRAILIERLFSSQTGAVLICGEPAKAKALVPTANAAQIPLWTTTASVTTALTQLTRYQHDIQQSLLFHGELLEIFGLGVMLMGDSGIGKSELALELVSRGHRLIADDSIHLRRVAPTVLEGICPLNLRDFLEVRGLGIINIRRTFGDSAIKRNKRVRLIIHLMRQENISFSAEHRLHGAREVRHLLDVQLPSLTLPVAPGRNLAVLVECAVHDHIQRLNGYCAEQDLAQRLQNEMASIQPCE